VRNCAREITAVDGIKEETREGSVAMTGCPPQWLDRRGFLMRESYSSSMVLLIRTMSLYNPGLPQISQLIKTDLIFPNLSLYYVEDSCCLFAPIGLAHKGQQV
jgi:hypothetical protein